MSTHPTDGGPAFCSRGSETTMRVVNLERQGCIPHVPIGDIGHERAVVVSTIETAQHPLTGKPQPKELFRGTLNECNDFALSAREAKR